MPENNFQEIFKEILNARSGKPTEQRDKVGDAISLIFAVTVATKEISKVIQDFRQPLPQVGKLT